MSSNIYNRLESAPPASLANMGTLALGPFVARIALEQVAAFFAGAGEPLLILPGVSLLP